MLQGLAAVSIEDIEACAKLMNGFITELDLLEPEVFVGGETRLIVGRAGFHAWDKT